MNLAGHESKNGSAPQPSESLHPNQGLAPDLSQILTSYANEVKASQSADALHQLRVTLRKIRALVSAGKKQMNEEELTRVKSGIKWLSEVTSPARDADVQIAHNEQRSKKLPAKTVEKLSAKKMDAYQKVIEALTCEAFPEFCAAVSTATETARTKETLAPDIVQERIKRLLKKSLKRGESMDGASEDADFHELRKLLKKLRYTLGFLISSAPDKHYVKAEKNLKQIQDYLGIYQDQTVMAAELSQRANELISSDNSDAKELFEIGMEIGKLKEHLLVMRQGFPKVFQKFSKAMRHHLLKG